jgi:hypothetical protein
MILHHSGLAGALGLVALYTMLSVSHADSLRQGEPRGIEISMTAESRRAADFVNDNRLDLSGGPTRAGRVINGPGGHLYMRDHELRVDGLADVQGVMEIMDSQVYFDGGLTVSGAFLFDPSTIIVTNMVVEPDGYLQETGGPGDRFVITGNFINKSIRNTDWDTDAAIFQFNGGTRTAGNPQTLEGAGVDIGNLQLAWTDNFVFGTLQIGTSHTYVRLVNDYDNSTACISVHCQTGANEALYVNELIVESGATLDLAGLNLYVRNTFTNNGGTVVNGSVIVGVNAADGDINDSGQVNAADILLADRHVLGITTLSA